MMTDIFRVNMIIDVIPEVVKTTALTNEFLGAVRELCGKKRLPSYAGRIFQIIHKVRNCYKTER